jgi:Fe-S-cluster containining protein
MVRDNTVLIKYRTFVEEIDSVFERMQELYPKEMQCDSGCNDCCSAIFYIQLIEAVNIGMGFRELPEFVQNRVIERAENSHRLNEELHQRIVELREKGQMEALAELSIQRVPCPLQEDGRCLLYNLRPVTCRLYGIPTLINGEICSCPLSKFKLNENYPVVDMDDINARLREFSQELYKLLTNQEMPPEGILLPVSAVILKQEIATGIEEQEENQ